MRSIESYLISRKNIVDEKKRIKTTDYNTYMIMYVIHNLV